MTSYNDEGDHDKHKHTKGDDSSDKADDDPNIKKDVKKKKVNRRKSQIEFEQIN